MTYKVIEKEGSADKVYQGYKQHVITLNSTALLLTSAHGFNFNAHDTKLLVIWCRNNLNEHFVVVLIEKNWLPLWVLACVKDLTAP